MGVTTVGSRPIRELLTEAILEVLRSWPELDRRVFVQAHYAGHSVEQVSSNLGLNISEVRSILERCERKLYLALKVFRQSSFDPRLLASIRRSALAVN